jgi:small subunit ribosomal protein S21
MVMVFVKVTGNNLQKAIGVFNKKVKQAGIVQEVYRRQEYIKPSVKRKLKKEEAIKKRIREEKKKRNKKKYNKF